jgi:hypothetical protein
VINSPIQLVIHSNFTTRSYSLIRNLVAASAAEMDVPLIDGVRQAAACRQGSGHDVTKGGITFFLKFP